MKGIVFVLHGRRDRIAKANLEAVEKLASLLDQAGILHRVGLLEGTYQTLETALHELLSAGVSEFTLVPVLLFAATHVKEDLPQRARQTLGAAPVQILEPLGTTVAIYQALKDSLAAGFTEYPTRRGLLIAHGTPHYSEPNRQLQVIAENLSADLGHKVIGVNYLGAANYLELLAEFPAEAFVIQPFFLTEGQLVAKITEQIRTGHGTFDRVLPTLESSPAVTAALKERLVSAGCIPS